MPLVFGLARTVAGWLVGIPVLLVALGFVSELSNLAVVAVLTVPRFVISFLLIQRWFPPIGGYREASVWACASVVMAGALDVLMLTNAAQISWLSVPWC